MKEPLEAPIIGELLGLLAHDLRNPLSALHSNLGFLRSTLGGADQDSQEAVEDGLVSCDGLAHIIDNIDLLGQALAQAERPADRQSVDLAVLAAEVVQHAEPMGKSHGVHLVLAPASGQTLASGIRDLLFRALSNVVRNSIQHSSPGSSVAVSVAARPSEFAVVVKDAGSSLDGAVRDLAFTAQGQLTSKSVPNGRYSRGLGLYCAALAAEAAGARVQAVDAGSDARNAFELVVPRDG